MHLRNDISQARLRNFFSVKLDNLKVWPRPFSRQSNCHSQLILIVSNTTSQPNARLLKMLGQSKRSEALMPNSGPINSALRTVRVNE